MERTLQCPACERALTLVTVGSLEVDACVGGCAGIWFDHFELKQVDEPSEVAGEQLLDIARDPALEVDMERRRHCPVCKDVVMMRHFWSPKHQVTIDECPTCGGIWLDAGELAAIRAEYPSEAARNEAIHQHLSKMFDAEFAAETARIEAQAARAQKVAKAFRFLCPSWYIPGKQSWGAF